MSDYRISTIHSWDQRALEEVKELLGQEGLRLDKNLDYTCAIYSGDDDMAATGSCFGNTLRCMAVNKKYQGEGLLNTLLSHLMEVQMERGHTHMFLYTKNDSAKFFGDLGFYEIVSLENRLVFMENRKNGFAAYLQHLQAGYRAGERIGALVMNANPFTLGHQYLAEKAAGENEVLHLFMVSEEASLVPFPIRKKLVMEGTAHLKNIVYHDSGSYMISSATFPSYFQREGESVIEGQALLDLTIFSRIAKALGIQRRYVGEEPFSLVTGIYNKIMADALPQNGISCVILSRKSLGQEVISASAARRAIQRGDFEKLARLVPKTTLDFFQSPEAKEVIARIQAQDNVIHY